MNQPNRRYPLILIGFCRRWESRADDLNIEVVDKTTQFYLFKDRQDQSLGPSEMQKYSKWGFLLTWPLCLTAWFQIKPQTPNKPGSEIVPFLRLALWRWDPGMNKYIGPGSYFLGLHWD